VAHTNADSAPDGVSDALAERLGLSEVRPLDPDPADPLDTLVTFVPVADAQRLIDALAQAGAGQLGDYDRCAFVSEGIGTFRPGPAARPAVGTVGEIVTVAEARIQMVLPAGRRAAVIAALRAAHPYEEPAYDLLAHAPEAGPRGTGRIGRLAAPLTLAEFVTRAAEALPRTVWGVRAAGDPDQMLRTVAVCGGSGGSLIERARAAGADVYLTADLKHHTALEAVGERASAGLALVDAAHWATEAPWLDLLAAKLRTCFGADGLTVAVSAQVTDPWTLHRHPTSSNESQP